MKITKATEYKKPLYALGVAAMITATMTGCGQSRGGDVDLAGDTTVYEDPDKDVELAGDVAGPIDYDPVDYMGEVAMPVDDDSLTLDGVIEMPVDDDNIVELDGDVAVPTDDELATSKQPGQSEDESEDKAEDKNKDEVVYIPILEYGDHLDLEGGAQLNDPYAN